MALLLMWQVMKYDETSRSCAASRWGTAAEDIECQSASRILQDAELLLKPRLLLLEFDASACPPWRLWGEMKSVPFCVLVT